MKNAVKNMVLATILPKIPLRRKKPPQNFRMRRKKPPQNFRLRRNNPPKIFRLWRNDPPPFKKSPASTEIIRAMSINCIHDVMSIIQRDQHQQNDDQIVLIP